MKVYEMIEEMKKYEMIKWNAEECAIYDATWKCLACAQEDFELLRKCQNLERRRYLVVRIEMSIQCACRIAAGAGTPLAYWFASACGNVLGHELVHGRSWEETIWRDGEPDMPWHYGSEG
jgi:hypothetical protein